MKRTIGASGIALLLALAAPASADVKPGEKEKVPDGQGRGKGMVEEQKRENPLPGIVERMKEVERKLAETDTGRWTKEEQERIVKALEFEGNVIEALEKLIEEVENRPP